MKSAALRKIISVVMCFSLLGLAGCVNDKPVDSQTESTSSSTSTTTTTTTSTTTTTTTTSSTTAKPTQPSSTNPTTTSTTRNPREDDPSVEKLVALTFDDGPYAPVTNKILDTLEKHGAKATFFIVGNRIDNYASTVRRASALGCEIASHTWSHKNLSKLTVAQMAEEINKSVNKIEAVTGKKVTLVRPPEGAANDTVKNNVPYPLIMWSVDSMDWKNRNVQKNYDAVMSTVFDGSIILMHDLYPQTADAVAKFVPELMAKGYKFVTVTELMEARGVTMQNGKKYSKARP